MIFLITDVSRFKAITEKFSHGIVPKLYVTILRFEGLTPAGFSV